MGTPVFALPALDALAKVHDIVAVYCQPPKAQNRGHMVQLQPVHEHANQLNLPVYTPVSLKHVDVQKQFQSHQADVAVVVAYGLILPQEILDMPVHGCINIHGSLLPRWRGAAPIHRALLAGDAETGITTMRMDAGLDTGPMLLKEAVPISLTATSSDLHDQLAQIGANLIVQTLEKLEAGSLVEVCQPNDGVTYADKIQKEEGLLLWDQPVDYLHRQVRALNPWPGTWFDYHGTSIRVHQAHPVYGDVTLPFGSFVKTPKNPWMIACQGGYLSLEIVQKPGGKAMPVSEFLRGFPVPPDTFHSLGDF